ncbi:MAG: hypothetical protein J0H75_16500, partial [Rhizobiales bacterium]|nr:hypothetical protein [Hyphomicrobiales bacterium]
GEMNDAADDAGEEIGDDFDEAAGDDEAAEEGVPPQRREPELSAPRRVEPAMRFEPEPSARPTAGHPDTPSPSAEFRRLDTDRLRAVLTELTACRQLLEAALKEG